MNDIEERFRTLYLDSYDPVVRFVRRRCPPAEADDIVAETFLVAWRRFEGVPARTEEQLAWIYAVARNCMLNSTRGHRRRTSLAVRIADQRPPGHPDETDAVLDRIDLATSWRQLPDDDQEVLALKLWEGLTSTQAATVLGATPSAARVRLSRAKRRLRSLLTQVSDTADRHEPIAPIPPTRDQEVLR